MTVIIALAILLAAVHHFRDVTLEPESGFFADDGEVADDSTARVLTVLPRS